MALHASTVQIESPCPIDLDGSQMRGSGRNWHCGRCDKTVHVLSQMTEVQARDFLRARAGEDLCVSYTMSAAGEVRFRPEPFVPAASLLRRPARLAAAGFGLALAACTPHDNPEVAPHAVVGTESAGQALTRPTIPLSPPVIRPPVASDDLQVDGGMRAPPRDLQVEGGMRPTPLADEPCDPPEKVRPRGRMTVR